MDSVAERLPSIEAALTHAPPARTPKLLRSLFHMGMGGACFSLYQFFLTRGQAIWVLGAFVAFFGTIEVVRRFSEPINRFWTDKIFGAVARPQERHQVNSATFYMLGLTAIVLFASQPIVCASVLILGFADPAAAAVGYRWPIFRFANRKSVGGVLAFLLAGMAVTVPYFTILGQHSLTLNLGVAAAMVLTASVAELFGHKLDDNFSIPVAAALAGVGAMALLG